MDGRAERPMYDPGSMPAEYVLAFLESVYPVVDDSEAREHVLDARLGLARYVQRDGGPVPRPGSGLEVEAVTAEDALQYVEQELEQVRAVNAAADGMYQDAVEELETVAEDFEAFMDWYNTAGRHKQLALAVR